MKAGACGEVWARGSWLEDKEGKWGAWSRGLEGDLEGICLVMGKYGVLKWEKALKSYSGLIFGVGVQCCPKDSHIFMLWLFIRMPQWKRCETIILAKAVGI